MCCWRDVHIGMCGSFMPESRMIMSQKKVCCWGRRENRDVRHDTYLSCKRKKGKGLTCRWPPPLQGIDTQGRGGGKRGLAPLACVSVVHVFTSRMGPPRVIVKRLLYIMPCMRKEQRVKHVLFPGGLR